MDSGATRADILRPNTYLCMYFARGACVSGPDCLFLHRVPCEDDTRRIDTLHDIFGRGMSCCDAPCRVAVAAYNCYATVQLSFDAKTALLESRCHVERAFIV